MRRHLDCTIAGARVVRAPDRRLRHNPRVGGSWRWPALVVALGLVLGGLIGVAPAARAETTPKTIELAATDVTHTNMVMPLSNYATSPYASVSRLLYTSYIAFDLSGLTTDDTIASANVVVDVEHSNAVGRGLQARYTDTDWSASRVVFWNRPHPTTPVISGPEDREPTTGTRVKIPILDRSGLRAGSRVSLQLEFTTPFQEIRLAKQRPPRLELLVTSSAEAEIPTRPVRGLPYEVPVIGQGEKRVFAHYFPPFPISFDNLPAERDYYSVNYLRPEGENGKFASVGGLLRDRPRPRPPIDADYELADAETEVNQATAAGIDGFTVNILTWSGDLWSRTLRMAEAASRQGDGFVVVPNLDLASNAGEESLETIADRLAQFFASPASYQLPDGRYVLSSFKAEAKPVSWWRDLVSRLEAKGVSVALISVLLATTEEHLREYAPISYALSSWGARTSGSAVSAPNWASFARRAGARWMAPVAVQDVRHHSLMYAEAGNTETLRATWQRAISDEADLVQLVTWNDYAESTHFAPSVAHRDSLLDINGFYLATFKQGAAPRLNSDEIILTHRIQRHDAKPRIQGGRMTPNLAGSTVRPRDTVEVVAMLKAPAVIKIKAGDHRSSFSAPAGLSFSTVPLRAGTVSAMATRGPHQVAAVTSPYRVVDRPDYYDLQYYAASSRGS